ncbi:hypothetical protein KKF55_02165 [Patescibacteria group bacterium]|nr:hypothetical protein [Patescibacteria group bacterium]
MLTSLLDLLFPRTSLTGEAGEWITDEERKQLASSPVIEKKGQLQARGLESIDCIYAGSNYPNCPLLKKAIHTFKFKRVRSLADDLAELMIKATPDLKDAVLCPVPLHWSRRFSRGFNQSELLSNIVGAKLNIPVQNLVKRIRPTGHQVGRTRSERLVALKDAFRCTSINPPLRVIMIDDLATTGATMDECAKALKQAGVERVEGWVVAHG